MSIAARARMRPVLYPAAILVAFILNLLVDTGVSPYAAARPLILALLIGLAVPWVAGLATADRHRAGVLGVTLALGPILAASAPAGSVPALAALGLVTLALVALQPALKRRSTSSAAPARDLLPVATRVLTIASVILLVAVGIKAVQLGRVETFAGDLVAEFPLRPHGAAASPGTIGAPNLFFIMLDGYPRADKLLSEFGIDNAAFIADLRARDFAVAGRSRSNQTRTLLTLAQMFNYYSTENVARDLDDPDRLWRLDINNGAFFGDLHERGYETVAVSSGWEQSALRRVDQFVDTGQLNEFEWAVAQMTGVSVLADAVMPDVAASSRRSRILGGFRVAEQEAQSLRGSRKFVFVHIAAPHAPQVFDAAGRPLDVRGFALQYGDALEISRFGFEEYTRRLEGQLEFLNGRTIHLIDSVVASDPGAVVVVFSDHGTNAPPRAPGDTPPYADLRTANLLAVRSPGHPGIIDDRSTLANLLPRLLRAYTGSGPADVPETIYAWTGIQSTSFFFERPD